MRNRLFPIPLTAAGCTSQASSRATPDGSFLSAAFPGTPNSKSGVEDTAAGGIRHHTLSARNGDAELSLTATQLPATVTVMTTDNMLYRKARNELLENYDATRTSWSSCRHAGHPCRKLGYSTRDGRHGIAHFYLDDGTLAIANSIYKDDEKTATSFLASVQ